MAKWTSPKKIRDRFLAWQCRIRQTAMREASGRPSPGMRPRVLDTAGRELAPALTVLLIPRGLRARLLPFSGDETPDPRDVYERALGVSPGDYFQAPGGFSDKFVAVLSPSSTLAESLLDNGACVFEFDQSRKRYHIPCEVRVLKPGNKTREAAIWHNRLFNPALPDTVQVISFSPDWTSAEG
jgi:hypothetical protein